MTTNEIWMDGFSVTPDEVARDAFVAGLYYGLWMQPKIQEGGYFINPRIKNELFAEWKKEVRTSEAMDDRGDSSDSGSNTESQESSA